MLLYKLHVHINKKLLICFDQEFDVIPVILKLVIKNCPCNIQRFLKL